MLEASSELPRRAGSKLSRSGSKWGLLGFGWVLTLSGHFGAGDEEENAHSIEEAESQSEEGRERVRTIVDDEEAIEEGRRREM